MESRESFPGSGEGRSASTAPTQGPEHWAGTPEPSCLARGWGELQTFAPYLGSQAAGLRGEVGTKRFRCDGLYLWQAASLQP